MWTKCSVVAWPDKEYQILDPSPTWQYVVKGSENTRSIKVPIVVQSSGRTVERIGRGDSRVGTQAASCYRRLPSNEAGEVVCAVCVVRGRCIKVSSEMHPIVGIWPIDVAEGLIRLGAVRSCPELGVPSKALCGRRAEVLSSGASSSVATLCGNRYQQPMLHKHLGTVDTCLRLGLLTGIVSAALI